MYVPAWLPGEGPFRLADFQADQNGYRFKVIRGQGREPARGENLSYSEADLVVEVTASNQPFPPYPVQEQLLAQPAGDVDLDGIAARSFGKGMMLTWSAGNWEYTALGRAPGDGARVAGEILQALPDNDIPVPTASQGRIRAAQLGNPMYVTASWTYDGKTWYTLDGRGTPEEMEQVARSMTLLAKLDSSFSTAGASGVSAARATLNKYFRVLEEVANNRYGGFYSSREAQEEALRPPYSFLSAGLQQKCPFADFCSRLEPVADLQVLQLWEAPGRVEQSASPPAGQRFFVELKTVENLTGKTAQVYSSGYLTLGQENGEWRITGGSLEQPPLSLCEWPLIIGWTPFSPVTSTCTTGSTCREYRTLLLPEPAQICMLLRNPAAIITTCVAA